MPWPPSIGAYRSPVSIKGKLRLILTKKARAYKILCRKLIITDKKLSGPLTVYIYLYQPDNRRRDVDNYCKAILDALTECGVWEDDSQIYLLIIKKGEVQKGGSVIVTIYETGENFQWKEKQ